MTRRQSGAGVLGALAVAASGAGCVPEPSTCGDELPRVVVTDPEDLGAPLVDGDDLPIVHGPQGGWHVEVGLRVTDPDPAVALDLTVDALGARVVDNHYDLRVLDHDGCTGGREGLFGFLAVQALADGDRKTPPEVLVGETLTVRARVEASRGIGEDVVELVGVD